jgi:hypothetical protein
MAHAQKPDFVFRRNRRVHLNRQGRQFSRLLAAEVCTSAVVMLDTTSSELVKGTGYPLYSPVSLSLPLPCVTVCHHVSTGLYLLSSKNIFLSTVLSNTSSLCTFLEKQNFQSYIKQQKALTKQLGELFHIWNYCSLVTKQQAARPTNNGSIPERWQEIFLCPTTFIRLWSTSSLLSNGYMIFF